MVYRTTPKYVVHTAENESFKGIRLSADQKSRLLLDESGSGREPVILTDILGSEDALGTMDFKVAGDDKAITAFQLDTEYISGVDTLVATRPFRKSRYLPGTNR